MIKVNETAEYEVGFEISCVVGQVNRIKSEIENRNPINKPAVITRLDNILSRLEKIHNMMAQDK